MQRRRLQLVADRAVDRLGVQEMVGIDALRRARIAVDAPCEKGERRPAGMQEGAGPEQAVRVRRVRAQQQAGVDRVALGYQALGARA
jgi:hypothetical protein